MPANTGTPAPTTATPAPAAPAATATPVISAGNIQTGRFLVGQVEILDIDDQKKLGVTALAVNDRLSLTLAEYTGPTTTSGHCIVYTVTATVVNVAKEQVQVRYRAVKHEITMVLPHAPGVSPAVVAISIHTGVGSLLAGQMAARRNFFDVVEFPISFGSELERREWEFDFYTVTGLSLSGERPLGDNVVDTSAPATETMATLLRSVYQAWRTCLESKAPYEASQANRQALQRHMDEWIERILKHKKKSVQKFRALTANPHASRFGAFEEACQEDFKKI